MPIDGIKVPGHFTTGTCRGYVMDAKYVKGGYIVVNEYNDLATLTDEVPGSIITGSPVYVVADNMTYRAIYDEQSDTFSWEQDTADQQEISAEILSLQKDVNSIGQALQLKANVSDIPTNVSQLTNDSGYTTITEVQGLLNNYVTENELETELSSYATLEQLSSKQDTLVSGTNIKTINGQTILGEGNIEIQGGSGGTPPIATTDAVGGILATDSGENEDVSAYVDVESDGKAFVKIPSVDETSTADDVVNLLNTSTLILNGNAE